MSSSATLEHTQADLGRMVGYLVPPKLRSREEI
jgi:hypothetical protein